MVTVLKLFKIEVEKISLVVFRAKKPKISYLRKQNESWDIQYIKMISDIEEDSATEAKI